MIHYHLNTTRFLFKAPLNFCLVVEVEKSQADVQYIVKCICQKCSYIDIMNSLIWY